MCKLMTVFLMLFAIENGAWALPPVLLTPTLPNAVMNVPFNGRLMIAGMTLGGPSVNTLTGLPAGLTYSISAGNVGTVVISGTPTVAGNFPISITSTNPDGTLTINVPFRVDQFAANVASISSGGSHTCAVVNGGVQCWGSNASGELGNNSTTFSSTAVRAISPGSNATAVSSGGSHTCAVVAGGVQCWGDNSSGQLGNNSNAPSLIPISVLPAGSGANAVAAGASHTCAVINAGVKCWGANFIGQLGNGSNTNSLVPVVTIPALSGVAAIASGNDHSCAVVNGGVRCWGVNGLGTLGNGTIVSSNVPVTAVPAANGATAVSLGGNHSCAIIAGHVSCWGQNTVGQTGTYNTSELFPAVINGNPGASGVTSLAAGRFHTCAARADGVYCWGNNISAQVGTTGYDIVNTPALTLPSGSVTGVSAGSAHSCAIVSGSVQCWGSNSAGALGTTSNIFISAPVVSLPVTAGGGGGSVAAGRDYTCAASSLSSYKCWGNNDGGKLGYSGFDGESNVPVDVALLPPTTQVLRGAVRDLHSCALVDRGVQCWGDNSNGQLGNNSVNSSRTPVQAISPSSNITAVVTGSGFSCAAAGDGTVYCWGLNNFGQLGNGSTTPSQVPVVTIPAGSSVGSLAAGASHACAVVGGVVKCWGTNGTGQLGVTVTNSFGYSTVPVDSLTLATGVSALVTAGTSHTCASGPYGMKCWGGNSAGQLGNNSTANSTTPVTAIAAGSTILGIAAGNEHTCAIVNGGVQCWGRNTFGQLGNRTTTNSLVPVNAIPANAGVFSISAGFDHTCAGVNVGVVCWGSNAVGQLADADTYPLRKVYAAIPVPSVPGAPSVINAVGGAGNATLTFIAPSSDGGLPIDSYTATCTSASLPSRSGTASGNATTIVVSGLTGNVQYNCTVAAINGIGTGPASFGINVFPTAAPIELFAVFSRKTHGATTYDLPLDRFAAVGGNVTIEPRAIGAGHRIVFQFNNSIFQLGSVLVTDSVGAPIGTASLSPNGNEVVVTLTGIADKKRVNVALSNVNGSGTGNVAVGFLVGDVNANRAVAATDLSGVRALAGLPASASNYRFDLNASGFITAADIATSKARQGAVLP